MITYEELLKETALADERFVVMTAENRALVRNLPQVLGDRFIDTGITEQTMLGAAAGLALRGRIPVVHALSAFLTMRAFEFTRTSVHSEFTRKNEQFHSGCFIRWKWPYPPGY
jgi:transketolase